jgi:hypothetical protein
LSKGEALIRPKPKDLNERGVVDAGPGLCFAGSGCVTRSPRPRSTVWGATRPGPPMPSPPTVSIQIA